MRSPLSRLERMLGPSQSPEKKRKTANVRNLPEGEWVNDGVYRIRSVIPAGNRIGQIPLGDDPPKNMDPWGAAEPALFLDLETTGLAGGTGTYAFLAGLGRFRNRAFVIDQIFLTTPSAEKAWIGAVENLINEAGGFVSYNGKRFDMPLLETRTVLQGQRPDWSGLPHLDLLHLARSFWKRTLPSCRLADVERHILGLEREGTDVPGALVPELYRLFLEDGNTAPLEGVFYHNRMDILSLASLRTHLALLMEGRHGAPREQVAAGDLWFRKGHHEQAREIWDGVCSSGHCAPALERLAKLAKKRRDWEEAAALWEKALPHTQRPVEDHVELAKIYEHRTKDLSRALKMTDRALEILKEHRAFGGASWRQTRQDLRHRRERLKRKLARPGQATRRTPGP